MIAVLLILVVVLLGMAGYLYLSDPAWRRSQAEAEIQMYAARRAREVDELKRAMRRDAQRVRYDFDAELEELDE